MTYLSWTDGVSPLTAADLAALQDQTIIRFTDSAARTAAMPTPITGCVTYRADVASFEQWTGSAWTVLLSRPQRVPVSGTPDSGTSAATAPLLTQATVVTGSTYRVTGLLRTTPTNGTFKMTTLGSVSGMVGILGASTSNATTFDQTSASSILDIPAGLSSVVGEITATGTGTWSWHAYNRTNTAVLASGSFLQIERIG